ncbi:hypothetical protein AOY63_10030 [Escherichia coli]|nr:hypothetical protein AOY63_10030 [Escherichia coli]
MALRNPQYWAGKKGRHRVLCSTNLYIQFNELTSIPARQVFQNFFRSTLAPFHKYQQNDLLDTTITPINGA